MRRWPALFIILLFALTADLSTLGQQAINCRAKKTIRAYKHIAQSVAYSPDGKMLAAAGDYDLKVYDSSTGRQVFSTNYYRTRSGDALSVDFSPDGKTIALAREDVELFDAKSGKQVKALEGHKESVNTVKFSSDGSMLASGGNDKAVKIWDSATGDELKSWDIYSGPQYWGVQDVAWSPDGKVLAAAGCSEFGKLPGNPHPQCVKGLIAIFDVASGKKIKEMKGHDRLVLSLAFSPDGNILVSGGSDGAMMLWNVQTGNEIATIASDNRVWGSTREEIYAVTFTPDGKYLVSGGWCGKRSESDNECTEGLVKFSNPLDGKQIYSFAAHSKMVSGLDFSPDGKYMASAGLDHTLKIWECRY